MQETGSSSSPKRQKSEGRVVYVVSTSSWIDSESNPDRVSKTVGVFVDENDAIRAGVESASKEMLADLEHWHETWLTRLTRRHQNTKKCRACKSLALCRNDCVNDDDDGDENCEICPACVFAFTTADLLKSADPKKCVEDWASAQEYAYGPSEFSDNSQATKVTVERHEVQ